jgi:hypothetical protein
VLQGHCESSDVSREAELAAIERLKNARPKIPASLGTGPMHAHQTVDELVGQ